MSPSVLFSIAKKSTIKIPLLLYLFSVCFPVSDARYGICRQVQFVAGGPPRASPYSLCCHSTNRAHCTHINLEIVCSVKFSLSTPPSISPVFMQSAVVWIINDGTTTNECAFRRHSGIWYYVPVSPPTGSHTVKK